MAYLAREAHISMPIIGSVLESNRAHFERALATILEARPRSVGVLGLAFKPGTDELRESPYVELVERLLGKGIEVTIFDPGIDPENLVGANLDYIEEHLPHLRTLLRKEPREAVSGADVCIVASRLDWVLEPLKESFEGTLVVDMIGAREALDSQPLPGPSYHGVAW